MTADSRSLYRKSSQNRLSSGFAIGIVSLLLAFALVLAPAWAGQTGQAGSFAKALKTGSAEVHQDRAGTAAMHICITGCDRAYASDTK